MIWGSKMLLNSKVSSCNVPSLRGVLLVRL